VPGEEAPSSAAWEALDLHERAGLFQDHRVRAWIRFAFDFALRLIAYALLLAIIAAAA
jgi:hypothetical protein